MIFLRVLLTIVLCVPVAFAALMLYADAHNESVSILKREKKK